MDILHSHIWTLLCNKDDTSWTIKDATLAIKYLFPHGRVHRYVQSPPSIVPIARKAAKQLGMSIDVYEMASPALTADPFWQRIETRICELAKRTDTHNGRLLHLLALLYVDLPPRRNKEFQTMVLDTRGKDRQGSRQNTFDGLFFCFRSYKSSMRDGHRHFDVAKVTSRLRDALEQWLRNHPCLPFENKNEIADFLCDAEGYGYEKINSFTRLLQKALGTSSQELRRKWFSRFT